MNTRMEWLLYPYAVKELAPLIRNWNKTVCPDGCPLCTPVLYGERSYGLQMTADSLNRLEDQDNVRSWLP
jgi:hypothetical protein